MPSPEQIAWAKVRVTTMIACAVAIASVLVYLLLGGAEFRQPALTIHTYFIDLSGLEKGNPVRFNGIRVGKVTATALSHSPDPQKVVRVDMLIVRRYARSIPQDSTAVVAADLLQVNRGDQVEILDSTDVADPNDNTKKERWLRVKAHDEEATEGWIESRNVMPEDVLEASKKLAAEADTVSAQRVLTIVQCPMKRRMYREAHELDHKPRTVPA